MTDKKFLALAETTILNIEGKTVSLEDLIDDNKVEKVLRFNKGAFSATAVSEVNPDDRSENVEIVRVTLQGGETFNILASSKTLTSNNEWVTGSQLAEGKCLKTLTYNPYNRHPEQKLKHVAKVETHRLSFSPVVEFGISAADNILVTVDKVSDKDLFILVPVQPETVAN